LIWVAIFWVAMAGPKTQEDWRLRSGHPRCGPVGPAVRFLHIGERSEAVLRAYDAGMASSEAYAFTNER
jgi:hypothetical protein